MIRSFAIGATVASVLVTGASAADMYTAPAGGGYKDEPYAAVQTWTGFYAGVNGGYAWGKSTVTGTVLDTKPILYSCVNTCPETLSGSASVDPSGGFGGGQVGYNYQRDWLVLGIEADIQGAGIDGSKNLSLFGGDFTMHGKSELDWFGTIRGRLGYAFDKTLVYFTGGLAAGGVKDSLTVTPYVYGVPESVSKSSTKVGFVLGGGVEQIINQSWSAKIEYQYIDLGGTTLSASAGCPLDYEGQGVLKSDHTYQTVRVGLNYHIQPSYEPLK